MYGAILGDIIGSPYEFDWNNIKTKNFPLFKEKSQFTDDSVMTIAVAEALLSCNIKEDNEYQIKKKLIDSLKKWGKLYPDAGYGGKFLWWLSDDRNREPYNSWGNGSAMRVSSVGWLYYNIVDTKKIARYSAEVTHNHPEGIKGAQSVACAIYLARNGYSKEFIKTYINLEFGYNLNRTCDEIRPKYVHVESCQETVPQAIIAFLEGEDFEDCIRNAVSLGGDSDTLTCITGSIAEAFFGIPEDLKKECFNRIDDQMKEVLIDFESKKIEMFH